MVVDAVINTGRSLDPVLAEVQKLQPKVVVVAALVAFRGAIERLTVMHPSVDFIVARVSDRSYVGSGGADTGARLFGTTTWDTKA